MPPAWLVPIGMAGLLGSLIGSFLNVVIHRLPRRMPMGMERSQCPKCGAAIAWFDNIPVVSFLVLRGRCRACRVPISIRYPLVELLTGVLFAFCAYRTLDAPWEPGLVAFLVSSTTCAALIVAASIDADTGRLPRAIHARLLPVTALVGALAVPAIHGTSLFGAELAGSGKPGFGSLLVGLAGAAIGGATAAVLRWGARRSLGRDTLRRDDVELAAALGLLLGPEGILLALATGVLGAGLGRLGAAARAGAARRELPAGPFLAAAGVALLLFRDPILRAVGLD